MNKEVNGVYGAGRQGNFYWGLYASRETRRERQLQGEAGKARII